jgi:hypothetical protein
VSAIENVGGFANYEPADYGYGTRETSPSFKTIEFIRKSFEIT